MKRSFMVLRNGAPVAYPSTRKKAKALAKKIMVKDLRATMCHVMEERTVVIPVARRQYSVDRQLINRGRYSRPQRSAA